MADPVENARLCSVCFKMCRDVCPVAGATRRESDSPHNRAYFAFEVMEGRKELTTDLVDYFYRCTLCRACREACETGLDVGQVMMGARSDIPDELLPERIREIKGAISKGRLPGRDSKKVKKIIGGHKKGREGTKDEKTLFLLGKRLRSGTGDGIRATLSVMGKLGADFNLMEDEPETGALPYFLGFTDIGKRHASEFVEKVKDISPEKVVVFSDSDLKMIKVEYQSLGLEMGDIEVLSHPEFLISLLKEKRPRFKDGGGKTIIYHDPGGLGRELRLFEAPREIVKTVPNIRLVELPFNRDAAPEPGYGLGLELTHPEITRLMAGRIKSMGIDTGADVMVMGDPVGREIIIRNVPDTSPMEVVDLVIFLDKFLA